jgi:hypothetical protein
MDNDRFVAPFIPHDVERKTVFPWTDPNDNIKAIALPLNAERKTVYPWEEISLSMLCKKLY